MKTFTMGFMTGEEGLTMVEYAIAGALVAAVAVAAFQLLGGNIVTQITALAGFVAT
jgi:pilus assembly protein Flp/PilA